MFARRKRGPVAGFSFVELLTVLVVLGILSSLAIPKYRNMKRKAYVATLVTDLRNLAGLQEQYWTDSKQYSTDLELLKFVSSDRVSIAVTYAGNNGWSATASHLNASVECAVYHGNAPPVGPAKTSGVIDCAG